jgi:hypothetical protein
MLTATRHQIAMRGDLCIITRDAASGSIIDTWDKKNIITFLAADDLVRLLAPNASFGATIQEESQIKSMRFGTSNTAPQRSDTNLNAEAIVSAIPVRVELLDANRLIGAGGTVEFTTTLDSTMANGVTLREAGLFTRGTADDPQTATGALLFAHQVFPDQPKTSAVELEFRWRISFTV